MPAAPIAAGPAPASAKVAVQSVEASAGGRLSPKGAAEPNATVRLYLSGAFIGDAKTSADGRRSLTIEHGMAPGAIECEPTRSIRRPPQSSRRADAPFEFPASPAGCIGAAGERRRERGRPGRGDGRLARGLVLDSVQTHHVERGHTLWGISQKYYGDGSRYQITSRPDTNQIRNPNLIHPGQLFVVPKPEPKP